VGPFSRPLVAALDMWTAQSPALPAPETGGQLEQRVTVDVGAEATADDRRGVIGARSAAKRE
jgi:hypothetical protein